MVVTISKVVIESVKNNEGKEQDKPVIYFKGVERGLIVNKTNWSLIAKQHTDESDSWIGKTIELTVTDVEAFGDIVSAIRVKPPRKIAPKGASMLAAPAAGSAHEMSSAEAPAQPGDDQITAFWTEAKKGGLDRKEGLEILNRHQGNFVTALKEVKTGIPF